MIDKAFEEPKGLMMSTSYYSYIRASAINRVIKSRISLCESI